MDKIVVPVCDIRLTWSPAFFCLLWRLCENHCTLKIPNLSEKSAYLLDDNTMNSSWSRLDSVYHVVIYRKWFVQVQDTDFSLAYTLEDTSSRHGVAYLVVDWGNEACGKPQAPKSIRSVPEKWYGKRDHDDNAVYYTLAALQDSRNLGKPSEIRSIFKTCGPSLENPDEPGNKCWLHFARARPVPCSRQKAAEI